MDCKIHFGLFFVIALVVVCHVTDYALASASSTTITAVPGASSSTTTTAPGKVASSSTTPTTKAPLNGATGAGTIAPVVTQKPTTPALINCNDETCTSDCRNLTSAKPCQSDTNKGCKAVKTTASGVDTYTFSCSTTACKSSDSTEYCCFEDKCNPLIQPKKSKATTMFGNLVSITIIVMLAYYV